MHGKCFKHFFEATFFFFPKVRANYEDAGAGNARKHEFIRSESDNWRTTRDEQNGEDDDGGWRLAGGRRENERWCPPSPGVLHALFVPSRTCIPNLKMLGSKQIPHLQMAHDQQGGGNTRINAGAFLLTQGMRSASVTVDLGRAVGA